MNSMTGYGRGQASEGSLAITVEMSAVNRKQLEPAINLPREIAALEPKVREILVAELSRGRINVLAIINIGGATGDELIDQTAAIKTHTSLKKLTETLGLTGGVDLRSLLAIPGVLRNGAPAVDVEVAWSVLEKAVRTALGQLITMRIREGEELHADLDTRIANIRRSLEKITALHPAVVEKYRVALHERVRKIGLEIPLDDDRLSKEVIFFADRIDISEEITRLGSHLAQFTEHLAKSEPVGRALEFIVQEIGRELNTLGAKANDAGISQIIVTCKAEMEKIREQVQNIE